MSTLRSIIIPYDLSCHRLSNHQILAISTPKSENRCSFLGNNGKLSLLSLRPASERKRDMTVYCSPLPPKPPSSPWKSWVLSILTMVILPFVKPSWRSILPISILPLNRLVDKAVEEAEIAANFVEKVAEEVEKVADEIADHLPEGTKASEVLRRVEEIAEKTEKIAETAEEVIHKVDKIEDDLEKSIEAAMGNKFGKDTLSTTDNKNEKETESAMDKDKENVVLKENVKNSEL
ncbi:hypothetical protein NE237_018516 [Protea cynaroides]|uniref:Uncharacterized protein n=1 Tax=Protea cynaroides TaxID=273540 RepID=A0A9Q0KA40_9MAGN|nr:hypothetical protein NE237_018516 [Protea cynaroides]